MIDLGAGGILKYFLAFVIGGALALLVKPLITALLTILLSGLAMLLILALLPGGFLASWLTVRLASPLLSSRMGLAFIILMVGALASTAYGEPALFLSGGLGGCLTASAFTRRPPTQSKARPPEVGKVEVRGWRGASLLEYLGSGVIVSGEESLEFCRSLIYDIVGSGGRVLIIGETSYIVPDGVNAVGYRAEKLNVVEDMLRDKRSVEDFVYAFTSANSLKNDDIPLLMNAAYTVLSDVESGRASREEFLKNVSEKMQDGRALNVKASLSMSSGNVGFEGLSLKGTPGEWQVLYISVKGLQERAAKFAVAYAILSLRGRDIVLLIHNPESVLKDVNLLPYDAREGWEHVFNAVAEWRDTGLILMSKSPIISQWAWQLCHVHVATRNPEAPARQLDGLSRQVYENARGLRRGEALVSLHGELFKLRFKAPEPARIKPMEVVAPGRVAQAVAAGLGGEAVEAVEEEPQPTLLEEMFGDKVVDAARLLEKARSGVDKASEPEVELVEELEARGLLTEFGGAHYISTTGLEVLTEYQEAVGGRGLPRCTHGGCGADRPPQARGLEGGGHVRARGGHVSSGGPRPDNPRLRSAFDRESRF